MLRPKHIVQKIPADALPLQSCLAKTYNSAQGKKLPGRTVFEHSIITGMLAQVLANLYPDSLYRIFFPAGYACIVGAHDVGKISPSFQKDIYGVTGSIPEGLENAPDKELEKQWGWHAGVGQATFDSCDCDAGKYLAEIVGRHHGRLNKSSCLSTDEILGGKAWHKLRLELLDTIKAHFKEPWPQINSQVQADVLAGLTTVADWIGSGSLFDNPQTDWRNYIAQAVQEAGFIKPDIISGLSFEDIFGNSPYPVQERFYNSCAGPGVYLLEAPMGLGKTEAALYAAYKLLSEKIATGLYFALPTRLTSDKIHQRVELFLQKILAPGSAHKHALLLHGNAHLQETEMGEDGAPGGEWFNSLKRAILAPFGVGTLDQALLAVLPDARHSFVRSFGLLGKVVILDEVHSYDVYTGVLLNSLIERLRQLHCTVIILSATLTQKRRSALLGCNVECENYPLISAIGLNESNLQEVGVLPQPDNEVALRTCQDDQDAFDEVLERAEQGQQVLWIENTVAAAQNSYRKLAAHSSENIELGLLHSRFLPGDRMRLEGIWTKYYGKDSGERGSHGRILVGTQVLEQSLDIDADFLVTRLCPVDMFLQRLGRLWRHTQNRAQSARREAWLLVPPQTEHILPEDFGKSAKVYYPYILFRTLEVLQTLNSVCLPGGIRPLLEAVYAEREESGLLEELKNKMLADAEKLSRYARLAQAELNQARSNSVATRYSEIDNTPVLLLRKAEQHKDGLRLCFIDGSEKVFPPNIRAYDRPAWRELALALASNTLSVANWHAPQGGLPKWVKDGLKNFIYLGADEAPTLCIALVLENNELRSLDGSFASDKYLLEYMAKLGYITAKK